MAEKKEMKAGSLDVKKITIPGAGSESVLIHVCRKDEDNGIPSEEIAVHTGQTLYKVKYILSSGIVYPSPFMDFVKVWKALMRSGVDCEKSSMIGSGMGASLILSLSQWCRDHGIPLPSSIVLDAPVLGYDSSDSGINAYLSTADFDDPYAYPLIGDYLFFPPVCLYDEDDKLILLRNRMREQGITYKYNRNSSILFHKEKTLKEEYIASASAFIVRNMH